MGGGWSEGQSLGKPERKFRWALHSTAATVDNIHVKVMKEFKVFSSQRSLWW